ncbi:hypothetical protein DPEC_G00013730 [Dallia pectoralis]|uniref:Uncharacterized protein n=1 Tax=Dallia pectoralis TaxID=75939 RepID=A0ACC2HN10_DALPE|nr:hypothetical protein DPEC_G00013730 [Dallia pectoralis]
MFTPVFTFIPDTQLRAAAPSKVYPRLQLGGPSEGFSFPLSLWPGSPLHPTIEAARRCAPSGHGPADPGDPGPACSLPSPQTSHFLAHFRDLGSEWSSIVLP